MPFHTPICEMFGIQHPIFLAGMGQVAYAEVCAAVSEAGGFGTLGMVGASPEGIRDEMRRIKRHAEPTDPASLSILADPDRGGAGTSAAALDRLRAAMAQLPDADRDIVELRHHGGMSFKQMSELLHEPLGTLLARHHRALRKLKQLMGGEEPGGEQ